MTKFLWPDNMKNKQTIPPSGPTTVARNHPGFKLSYQGHECQWNGPSWPYATSVTLTAMANLLNNYNQSVVGRTDYYELLKTYAASQRLKPMKAMWYPG